MSDNIIFNKKLEEYNKKYRNGRYKLLKYTKKEVEQYDKIANQTIKTKNYLLKGRKWALIGDTYYEIPKAPRALWFRNMNAGVKAATCALVGGAAIGGAGYGIYVAVANKGGQPVKPDPTPVIDRDIDLDESSKNYIGLSDKKMTSEGFECVLSVKDPETTGFTDYVTIKIGDTKLEKEDYTFDKTTGKLTIKKSALDKHKGKISIAPLFTKTATAEEVEKKAEESYEKYATKKAKHEEPKLTDYTTTATDSKGEEVDVEKSYVRTTKDDQGNYSTVMGVKVGTMEDYADVLVGGYGEDRIKELIDRLKNDYGENNVSQGTVQGENGATGTWVSAKEENVEVERLVVDENGNANEIMNEWTDWCLLTVDCVAQGEILPYEKELKEKGIFDFNPSPTAAYDKTIFAGEDLDKYEEQELTIPWSVVGDDDVNFTISSIRDEAFNAKDPNKPYKFTRVSIPYTIKEIGKGAFVNNTQLTNIDFELNCSNLTTIGISAFEGCEGLTSVHIPEKVNDIGQNAFLLNKGAITHVTIDSSDVANFTGNDSCLLTNAEYVYVRDDIEVKDTTYIGQNFNFLHWHSGYYVYEPKADISYMDFKQIGKNAVGVCYKQGQKLPKTGIIKIPSYINGEDCGLEPGKYYVTEILENGFALAAKEITKVVLPDGLLTIGQLAFGRCVSMSEVNIPSSVTKISIGAFKGCGEKLKEEGLKFKANFLDPEGWVAKIDSGETHTFDKEKLKDPEIAGEYLANNYVAYTWTKGDAPASDFTYTLREDNASYKVSAPGVTFVNPTTKIPASYLGLPVVEIGSFANCNLSQTVIPNSIKIIDAGAFTGCKSLESVTFSITEMWYQSEESGETVNVMNTSANAINLTDTVTENSWNKTGLINTKTYKKIDIFNQYFKTAADTFANSSTEYTKEKVTIKTPDPSKFNDFGIFYSASGARQCNINCTDASGTTVSEFAIGSTAYTDYINHLKDDDTLYKIGANECTYTDESTDAKLKRIKINNHGYISEFYYDDTEANTKIEFFIEFSGDPE